MSGEIVHAEYGIKDVPFIVIVFQPTRVVPRYLIAYMFFGSDNASPNPSLLDGLTFSRNFKALCSILIGVFNNFLSI